MTTTHPLDTRRTLRIVIVSIAMALAIGTGLASAQVAGNIAVYPADVEPRSDGTRQFSAYVPISPNTIVWLVNGIRGQRDAWAQSARRACTSRPPSSRPERLHDHGEEHGLPDVDRHGDADLTRPYPDSGASRLRRFTSASTTSRFNGSNFAPDSQALANGEPVPTTFVSSTKLVWRQGPRSAGTSMFAVRQPGTGSVTGNSVTRHVERGDRRRVRRADLGDVLPELAGLHRHGHRHANTAVTWSVNGVAGGSAGGRNNQRPRASTLRRRRCRRLPTVTVRATSVANPRRSRRRRSTLRAAGRQSRVAPATAISCRSGAPDVSRDGHRRSNTAVTWSVNGDAADRRPLGTISAGGVYTAPSPCRAERRHDSRDVGGEPTSFAQAP